MSKIFIYDVSAYVHTAVNGKDKDLAYLGFPISGIQFLASDLSVAIGDRDKVILAFDSRSFRKDLVPEYKKDRPLVPNVSIQIETLYEYLSGAGFTCHKYDGAEADDIINWAVSQNLLDSDGYSNDIFIRGNDYDLTINVQPNVIFQSINPKLVHDVNQANLSYALPYSEEILYNTVGPYKVFMGDSSDKIPVFKGKLGLPATKIYREFVEWYRTAFFERKIPDNWKYITGKSLIMAFIGMNIGKLFSNDDYTSEASINNLKTRIDLVYPLENTNNVSIVPDSMATVNLERYIRFLAMFNCRNAIRCLGARIPELDEKDRQIVLDKVKALNIGTYNVSRNLPVYEPTSNISLNSMDLFEGGGFV